MKSCDAVGVSGLGACATSPQGFVRPTRHPRADLLFVGLLFGVGVMHTASAFEFNLGDPDLKLRWDNTVKYSAAFRVRDRSDILTDASTLSGANTDDGDRNFATGLISNRLDLLTEMDASYKHFGARVSAAGWYDTVYHQHNDNNSPDSANALSVPYNQFTKDTRDIMGQYFELLDGFVYGKGQFGDMPVSFRLGKHTLLYGESLFFGANGIAAAQSRVDIVKAVAVPNSQFKEVLLPIPQASAQIGLLPNVTLGGYYQFAWQNDRIPPVGSYFSFADVVGPGAERLIAPTPAGPQTVLARGPDMKAKNEGQFGAELKYRPDSYDGEWGLYYAQFHSKDPIAYNHFDSGVYDLVYPEDIHAYGLSFSTTLRDLQVSTEVSARDNMPMTAPGGGVAFMAPTQANNSGNAAYTVGRSGHAQVSWIYNMPRTPFWEAGFFYGEVAYNRRLSVSKNPDEIDPNATRDASALWLSFQPQYFQVVPGLDLTVPFAMTYGIHGKASVVNFSPSAPYHGGNVSAGLNGTFRNVWIATINYTRYYGAAAQEIDQNGDQTFRNVWRDRDFVSLSLQRTF